MNRAHPPKVQYCSEVVGRQQKSMYFPATNKLLMTVLRRDATHPEMEYHRLVAFLWRLRIGRWKYLLTSRIHFRSPCRRSMKPQNYVSVSSYRKTDLFILAGKLKNSRNMEIKINPTSIFIICLQLRTSRLIVEISKEIRITDLQRNVTWMLWHIDRFSQMLRNVHDRISQWRMNKTSSFQFAITSKVRAQL